MDVTHPWVALFSQKDARVAWPGIADLVGESRRMAALYTPSAVLAAVWGWQVGTCTNPSIHAPRKGGDSVNIPYVLCKVTTQ